MNERPTLPPRKLLVIRLSSLGDVLLTTPALQSLATALPTTEIHYLTRKPSELLIRHHPAISRLWIYEESDTLRKKQMNLLLAEQYDAVIDWQMNWRSRRLHRVAPTVYRFKKHVFRRFLYVWFRLPFHQKPVPDRYLSALEPLGIRDAGSGLSLTIPPLTIDRMNQKFADWNRGETGPVFFIAAGARHATKRYPVAYLIRLMQMILEFSPRSRFILLGGADETEQAHQIKNAFPDHRLVWNAVGGFNLIESLCLLRYCAAGFSNDSLLMHAATALQVPVVAFFGSTTPALGFSPYRADALVVEDTQVACRPCSHIGRSACPKGHFRCMTTLDPESRFPEIWDFLRRILDGRPAS